MSNHTLRATRRFSISRKVALLFSMLALIGLGNWLVISLAQRQLSGAERDINATGSLRYLSQKIQATALDAAINRRASAEAENLIAEFERNLNQLEFRGETAGDRSNQAISKLLPALSSVRSVWLVYRDDVRTFLEALSTHSNLSEQLPRLSMGANQVLDHANQATLALTGQVGQIKQDAINNLSRLALIDLTILLAAFILTRSQIVRPLRRLADASMRFAGGDYDIRTNYRAQDEIGQVSEAFDHMAEQTQKHIAVMASDLEEIKQKQADLSKLSNAVENSPVSVVITDAEATIQYVNPTFTEISGYTYDEAVGQKPSMLKSGATSPGTYRDLWQTILAGEVWRGELMNRRKNGELFWEYTLISSVSSVRLNECANR